MSASPTARDRLALQRRTLAMRSAVLRAQAVSHADGLQPAVNWIDRVQDTWIWLRQRPPELVLPVTAVAALWVWRKPSRLWRLSWRAWSAWKLWQRVAQSSRSRAADPGFGAKR